MADGSMVERLAAKYASTVLIPPDPDDVADGRIYARFWLNAIADELEVMKDDRRNNPLVTCMSNTAQWLRAQAKGEGE